MKLRDLVDHDAIQKTNKFCVIGQKDGAFLGAYVYWQTEDQMIFWLPDPKNNYVPDALTDSPVQIDLKHGLRDEEDVKYDQYNDEMQRSYAESILQACKKSGQDFIVNKSN